MIKVSIDPQSVRLFRNRRDDFVKEAGRNMQDAMIQLAKTCAKELAVTIPPYGVSKKVGDKYQKSIAKQVNRAVSAANVAGVDGNAGEVHERFRNSRGQVPRGLRDRGQYKRDPVPVSDKERHIRQKMAEAGTAKGAWIAAAEKLNSKRIPGVAKWVRRHAKANGDASIKIKGAGRDVLLINRISYIARLQKENNVNLALKRGYLKNYRHMTIVVKKIRGEI